MLSKRELSNLFDHINQCFMVKVNDELFHVSVQTHSIEDKAFKSIKLWNSSKIFEIPDSDLLAATLITGDKTFKSLKLWNSSKSFEILDSDLLAATLNDGLMLFNGDNYEFLQLSSFDVQKGVLCKEKEIAETLNKTNEALDCAISHLEKNAYYNTHILDLIKDTLNPDNPDNVD